MLQEELDRLFELEEKSHNLRSHLGDLSYEYHCQNKELGNVNNQKMALQKKLSAIISPLRPQNLFFQREGRVFSVFIANTGMAVIKEMISVDEAEEKLMLMKMEQSK